MPPKPKPPTDDAESEGTRIVVKLDDLLYERRMTLTELAERIGITLANLSILKTGKAKAMRFSTLEAICRELRCQPGDLLGYDGEIIEGMTPENDQKSKLA